MYLLTAFCGLSKDIDTINHYILLELLEFYCIRGSAHNWFASYFSSRKQYTAHNNTTSHYKPINCVVQQGSVLGPILFLIYINDFTLCSNNLKLLLFEGDTNIFL